MAPLSPVAREFILHWGEMSSRWGINRSMAQIHALLFLSAQPLHAEAIAQQLQLARSNVSTSLRELQAWGIVRVVHLLGDRRDHFETMKDAWEMFRVILEERKRREVDPTLTMLRECTEAVEPRDENETFALEQMKALMRLLEMITAWHEQMARLPTPVQKKVLSMGDKIRRFAGSQ